MADYLRYLLGRFMVIPVTLLIVTAVLYGFVMLTPPEVRAELYMPNSLRVITPDALRHLVLPVLTLSLAHWATLGRITRALMIEELQKEYIVAAKARGVPTRGLVWGHAFRNTQFIEK